MTHPPTYLITGAGGGAGGISTRVVRQLLARGEAVRALVHRQDSRADALRAWGAEVIVGDLTNPVDVGAAMFGITRMFFNMSISPDYLEATAVVCVAAQDGNGLDLLVNMSQMTVSQMTATSTEESHQQRLHWLSVVSPRGKLDSWAMTVGMSPESGSPKRGVVATAGSSTRS